MLRRMSSSAMSTIANNLKQTQDRVAAASLRRTDDLQYFQPRLVAVSKTKSIDMIIEAYDAGQRNFGENYVMELVEKANDIELQDRCEDIKWHFIGHLQNNKIGKVLGIPNLNVVETIHSERLAKNVNDAWGRLNKEECLNVMVQVNTSGEDNKYGVPVGKTVDLVVYIQEKCPKLKLLGLMTIGAYGYDASKGLNPDFLALVKEREEVCKACNYDLKDLELSMGMSTDFEQAIEMGSSNVRIGSTIFGVREYSQKKSDNVKPPEKTTEIENPVKMSESEIPTEQIQQVSLT